jgi:hypothetical protein
MFGLHCGQDIAMKQRVGGSLMRPHRPLILPPLGLGQFALLSMHYNGRGRLSLATRRQRLVEREPREHNASIIDAMLAGLMSVSRSAPPLSTIDPPEAPGGLGIVPLQGCPDRDSGVMVSRGQARSVTENAPFLLDTTSG